MHSLEGKGYGIGNIGKEGMMAFIKTHKCNGICQVIALPRAHVGCADRLDAPAEVQ
jgi:hypothetical protein